MNDRLSAEARALLDANRNGQALSSAARVRIRAGVSARIAVAAGGGGSAAASPAALGPAAGTKAAAVKAAGIKLLATKLGAAGLVALAAGGGLVLVHGSSSTATSPDPAAVAATPSVTMKGDPVFSLAQPAMMGKDPPCPSAQPVTMEGPPARPATPPPEPIGSPALSAPPNRAAANPSPAPTAKEQGAAPGKPMQAAPMAPPPAASSIAEELGVLREAQSALRDGQAERAAALLDAYGEKHPNGVLREERDAARLVALCSHTPSPAAIAEARGFLAANATSPLAARVRAACLREERKDDPPR